MRVSLPNFLTVFRLFITPIFMILYLKGRWFGLSAAFLPYVLLFLLIITEITDAVDGYIARKFSQVTDLGKLLDPMADSVYRISLYLTFTQPPVNLPLILVFIFLARDSVISTLRTLCASRGQVLAARMSGKLKAILQAISFFFIIFAMFLCAKGIISTDDLEFFSTVIVSLVAFYSICSGVEYIWVNKSHLLQKNDSPDGES
ncbi:CDP-diacylglycerol--glycerol-3-phosphate 3-phosphatidyltransferase [Chlamydia trachomatis]|uniref:CDP-diacylglycerol--glycerol-3-phosphate 3-phosphatidyltransferase n=2 Tax=Chlamydia trachomatis TaxID=813 RepID=UPI0001B46EA8|nr:CDP-diacylglycerol--glycerol-3-phosphate 3-phosphatidyltransferase [Chlamydia trachomatis]ADH17601.1 CDP-diacylglycerol--glycerol-3-phosphate 3-phosphatidyltransferase [Chlamydia trachomatis E/150]ADH21293.1 CDP-diacylglycerol--glycerol-3-phosphate 3-phosphatidyltransferase [Chlamydia trachomatis E/11023]AGR96128.1 CDP-diacylglycerol--glycerol-3-phosphate 3-phosphatidyltransferase [Chlamydia trachomatis RC-F(s)/852]AGR99844.1 CDP-diacylglycerol--glycerol-3-phosphate 3-phosphatidyltransferase